MAERWTPPATQVGRPRAGIAARGQAIGVVAVFVLAAAFLGLVGAIAGWFGQLLAIVLIVPLGLILLDYRHGIVLALLLLPYTASPLMPQSVGNVAIVSIVLMFSLRWALVRIQGRAFDIPIDRQLLWLYLLPITAAAAMGSLHLSEIPWSYLIYNRLAEYNLRNYYWVSLYLKNMLLVVIALVAGAAVVQAGSARRFVVAMVLSGLLFVAATVVVVAITGVSLSNVMNMRESLHLIGRHNNEAGVMLLGVLGPVLFMREMSTRASLRFWLLVALAILVVGILLTGSRGAFLGLLVMSAWYLWRSRRLRTALMVLTLALIGFAVAPDAVRERLTVGLSERSAAMHLGSRGQDELTAGRVWIYEQMIPDALASPLIGRGMASTQWSTAVKRGIYSANHPHNLYLEVLLDMGLVGLVAMVLFWSFVWRRFVALGTDERLTGEMRGFFLGSAAGLLGMLTYGFSNGHYYPAPEQLFFWMSFGLAAGFARRLGSAPKPSQAAGAARGVRLQRRAWLG